LRYWTFTLYRTRLGRPVTSAFNLRHLVASYIAMPTACDYVLSRLECSFLENNTRRPCNTRLVSLCIIIRTLRLLRPWASLRYVHTLDMQGWSQLCPSASCDMVPLVVARHREWCWISTLPHVRPDALPDALSLLSKQDLTLMHSAVAQRRRSSSPHGE